jgi:hypothetical protein
MTNLFTGDRLGFVWEQLRAASSVDLLDAHERRIVEKHNLIRNTVYYDPLLDHREAHEGEELSQSAGSEDLDEAQTEQGDHEPNRLRQFDTQTPPYGGWPEEDGSPIEAEQEDDGEDSEDEVDMSFGPADDNDDEGDFQIVGRETLMYSTPPHVVDPMDGYSEEFTLAQRLDRARERRRG